MNYQCCTQNASFEISCKNISDEKSPNYENNFIGAHLRAPLFSLKELSISKIIFIWCLQIKKKKFDKKIVRKIHEIIQKSLNLKPITREIARFQEKYFDRYQNDAERIIEYLVIHKNEIIEQVSQLKNI